MSADPSFVDLDRLDAIMRDVIAQHSDKLSRVAAVAKLDPSFDLAEAVQMDRRVGWAYRLLDAQGPNAVVRDADREAMIADGLTAADAAFVDQHLAFLQSNGTVPTPRAKLAGLLERHGAAPTSMNIASAQSVYFRGLSLALFATRHRYSGYVPHADEILTAALEVDRRPASGPGRQAVVVPNTNESATEQPQPIMDYGIVELGEKLIAVRAGDKNWDAKTQRQARQIYSLLARFAQQECNVTTLATLSQNDLATFVDFLRSDIYNFYGKSPKDEHRSIKELRAEASKHPESTRGLEGGTLNRHLTNLGELFTFARGRGISIDQQIDPAALRSRRPKNARARDQRPKMDLAVSRRVFQASCFIGCAEWNRPYDDGAHVYHRALYFVPLLLEYHGARREEACGLAVEDVFLNETIPYLHIRNNDFRRIKNPQSDRLLPLHPEILRLGFLAYVQSIKALGYKRLFPDLYSPTTRSPLGDRFYDEFIPVLKWACEEEGVALRFVLHSIRHGFNSRLKHKSVDAEVRADLMGHAGKTETTERYANPVELRRALREITKLPIITSHLQPQPIQLLPWVEAHEVAPYSRARSGMK
jgi:integrase